MFKLWGLYKMNYKKSGFIVGIVLLIVLSSSISAFSTIKNRSNTTVASSMNDVKTIEITHSFSSVDIETYSDGIVIRVDECNFNIMKPGYPVIPTLVEIFNLPFGSMIESIEFEHGSILEIPLPGTLVYDKGSSIDSIVQYHKTPVAKVSLDGTFPESWVTSHTGGGLYYDEYTTYFVLRTYPIIYEPSENLIRFIDHINITVSYTEPEEPVIPDNDVYDLLIISPDSYISGLHPLVDHKLSKGVKTRVVGLTDVYDEMFWNGRDDPEKIKYFIKTAIEQWGISHVLLVGGLKGQTNQWLLPMRESHVVPPDEQEYAEQSFISDLYYADIYDSLGGFSSWDSNNDDQFAVWNEVYRETMDLYPDVYLGRIPCRTPNELRVMVDKIITYEKDRCDLSWFYNYLIVVGDSYIDENNYNEGELIGEASVELMPDFTPLRVYASMDDINQRTVNAQFNKGAGFAYFCGHGSPRGWSTHFPPADSEWTTGYNIENMIALRNQEKLPITVVGGCHNGKFDTNLGNMVRDIREYGIMAYFFQPPFRFYYNEWVPNCWAWWLTSKPNGGAIATIANTGLGTHGEDDSDHNGIIDYIEVLDGWMELRFLELFGIYDQDDLGENHGQTMTEYLHWFWGDHEKMDTKMVQQWQLFGDPSLKIGGYP